MGDVSTQGLELIGRMTAALRQVRDPERAMAVGLELLTSQLDARAGVAWTLDPAGQWRLLSTRGEPAAVEQLLIRRSAPDPDVGVAIEGPAAGGVQVWVGSSPGHPVAVLRLDGLADSWSDHRELAPLTAAVGGVLGGVWEHLTAHQRYEQVQQVAGVGSWQWQAPTDEVWLSEQMYRNLGIDPTRFEHTLGGYLARVHPDDRDLVLGQVEAARWSGGSWDTRHRLVTDDGEVRWLEGQGRVESDEDGTVVRIAGVGQDITARRELEEQLHARAITDELTGLANRGAFFRRLTQALDQDVDSGGGGDLVVALVDVDGFRSINEQLGWTVGDRLLQQIADRLRAVKGAELAARLSADEFAVLFHGPLLAAGVEQLGEDLAAHLHHPNPPEAEGRTVELAVGLASSLHDGALADQLLRAASVALRVAKSRSNGRWQVFDPAKHEDALQRLAVEADLRFAVEHGDIDVAYQPVISLETGEITAVEALARWERPGHGPVSPATFIPLAERIGLMPKLGAHVLGAACRQLRAWDQARPEARQLQMGVNLSAVQLDDPGLLEVVDDALTRAGLTADRLVLEVTETALSQDLPGALSRLFELRRRGSRIAIDDFGTGYSSLARLREIPFDILKIDRSFVKDIASLHEPTPILHALFSISRSLDLEVVAEGIETPAQLAVMLAHDCQSAQGFLFSRPVGPSDLETLLADGSGWDLRTLAGRVPTARTSPRLEQLLGEVASDDGSLSPSVLDEILATLAELTGLDSVYLTRIDLRNDIQHILAAHNQGPLQIGQGAQVPWTDTLCRRALAAGTPTIADVQGEHPDAHVAEELGISTYVGVEVRGPKGGLRGTLCGATAAITDVPEETVETLQWVARLLAGHAASETRQRGSEATRLRHEAARTRDEAAALRDEVAELRDQMAELRETGAELDGSSTAPPGGPAPGPGGGGSRTRTDRIRDEEAHDRDQAAEQRDQAAEQRDQTARATERSHNTGNADDARSRADAATARENAASDRRRSKQDRRRAADERTEAGIDRDSSAVDRRHAAQDREGSAADRMAAKAEIDAASVDALTATYARGPGMAELERDYSRANRSGEPMTLAFVDVDGLKATNDRDGHLAGDRLLHQVAAALTEHTRPHDLIIRYGGDEFLCALVGLTRTQAAERLAVVNVALSESSERGSITVGLAELEAGEPLSSLIQRADSDLYRQRRHR